MRLAAGPRVKLAVGRVHELTAWRCGARRVETSGGEEDKERSLAARATVANWTQARKEPNGDRIRGKALLEVEKRFCTSIDASWTLYRHPPLVATNPSQPVQGRRDERVSATRKIERSEGRCKSVMQLLSSSQSLKSYAPGLAAHLTLRKKPRRSLAPAHCRVHLSIRAGNTVLIACVCSTSALAAVTVPLHNSLPKRPGCEAPLGLDSVHHRFRMRLVC